MSTAESRQGGREGDSAKEGRIVSVSHFFLFLQESDVIAAEPDSPGLNCLEDDDVDGASPQPIVIKAELEPPPPPPPPPPPHQQHQQQAAGSPLCPASPHSPVELKPIVIKAEDPADQKLCGAQKAEAKEEEAVAAAAAAASRMLTLSDVTWQLFQQEKLRVNPAMSDSMFVHWLLTNIRPSAYFQQHYRAALPPHQPPPVMTPASGVSAPPPAAAAAANAGSAANGSSATEGHAVPGLVS